MFGLSSEFTEITERMFYNEHLSLYDVTYSGDLANVALTGCTGNPRNIIDLVETNSYGLEANAQGQVAAGAKLLSPNSLFLTGDQVYPDGVSEDATEARTELESYVFSHYRNIAEHVFMILGNHECKAHGKKQRTRADIASKGDVYLNAVNHAAEPNFYLTKKYYAQIARNQCGEVVAAIIFADTNLLPDDIAQQNWLLEIQEYFKVNAPNAPLLWVGHHAFADSIDGRGLKGDGGKYSASENFHKANHHQRIYDTLKRIGFNIKELAAVFAAHAHSNYVADNNLSSNLPHQFIGGGGGSWSNSLEQEALPLGTVWSACTFGFFQLMISKNNLTVNFIDCTKVKLTSPRKEQLNVLFSATITPSQRNEMTITRNSGLDPVLQKKFKKPLSLLSQTTHDASSSIALKLVCYLWSQAYKELELLCQTLSSTQIDSNPVNVLLLSPILEPKPSEISKENLLQMIEDCLLLFATKINDTFLGVKPYKKLFIALQACHHCLASTLRQNLSVTIEAEEEDRLSQRETFDLFRYQNNRQLQEDSDDEDEAAIEENENSTSASAANEILISTSDLCTSSLTSGGLKGTAVLQEKLMNFLTAFLKNSGLLRTALTLATSQYLVKISKDFPLEYSSDSKFEQYILAHKNEYIAGVYTVDFLINRLPPLVLIKAVIQTANQRNSGLSGMLFQQLANAFRLYLVNERKKPENTVSINKIFESWNSEHDDEYDVYINDGKDTCIIQRAYELLISYFKDMPLSFSDKIYIDLFDEKCLKTLWSGKDFNPWEPEFCKHFNIDMKDTKLDTWASLFGSTAAIVNPLHVSVPSNG